MSDIIFVITLIALIVCVVYIFKSEPSSPTELIIELEETKKELEFYRNIPVSKIEWSIPVDCEDKNKSREEIQEELLKGLVAQIKDRVKFTETYIPIWDETEYKAEIVVVVGYKED